MDTVTITITNDKAELALPDGSHTTTTPDATVDPDEWADQELAARNLRRTTAWTSWLAESLGDTVFVQAKVEHIEPSAVHPADDHDDVPELVTNIVTDHAAEAEAHLVDAVHAETEGEGSRADKAVATAQVHALLAIVDELRALREAVTR